MHAQPPRCAEMVLLFLWKLRTWSRPASNFSPIISRQMNNDNRSVWVKLFQNIVRVRFLRHGVDELSCYCNVLVTILVCWFIFWRTVFPVCYLFCLNQALSSFFLVVFFLNCVVYYGHFLCIVSLCWYVFCLLVLLVVSTCQVIG